MTEEVDAGRILARRATAVGNDENAGELEARLAAIGAELLVETLERLDDALDQAQPQGPPPTDGSAIAPRLTKSDGLIDWTRPAEEIRCQVRAFTPWPGAYSFLRREGATRRITLLRVKALADDTDRVPGVVVQGDGDVLRVQTGAGVLDVRELQPAGGRPMEVSAFLRGHVVREGDSFVGRQ
jgi:methionyl-tRNA formyltransferase